MNFEKIFIEERVFQDEATKTILKNIPHSEDKIHLIKEIDDVFQKVKKPYLQKRDNLSLFLGKKKGTIVKEAPNAYGKKGDPHFYFINNYNCPYECQYCYLQGFFNSPDIVHFVNYQDILSEIEKTIVQFQEKSSHVWFHAGEFSDSLALSHLTDEWGRYFELFKKYPKAVLELRTKSSNIKKLLDLTPVDNVVVSYTLSPLEQSKIYDLKTASLDARIRSIQKLQAKGYKIGLHFDPIIYQTHFEQDFLSLVQNLSSSIELSQVSYISLGVVRFTKEVYREASNNYPDSSLWQSEFKKSFDGKVRYIRPLRFYILKTVEKYLLESGVQPDKIYYCMENE